MSTRIDWKKISDLRRQPPPEVLFGGMICELLESETPSAPEPIHPGTPCAELFSNIEIALSGISESASHFVQDESPAIMEPRETVCAADATIATFEERPSAEESLPVLLAGPDDPILPVQEPARDSSAGDLLAMLLASDTTHEETGNSEIAPSVFEPGILAEEPNRRGQANSPRSTRARQIGRESCVVFLLAGEKFGIPIHQVVELDKLPRITEVPNVPYWVRGITNLRGEILSVLDLGLLTGLGRGDHSELGRMIVVRLATDLTAALVVDEVSGISNYVHDELTPPDTWLDEKLLCLLDGVYSGGEQAFKILNMDRLMATPELRELEAA